jgi:hypothetical protein
MNVENNKVMKIPMRKMINDFFELSNDSKGTEHIPYKNYQAVFYHSMIWTHIVSPVLLQYHKVPE